MDCSEIDWIDVNDAIALAKAEAWMVTKADAVAASTTVLLRTQESRAMIVALWYPGLLRSQENGFSFRCNVHSDQARPALHTSFSQLSQCSPLRVTAARGLVRILDCSEIDWIGWIDVNDAIALAKAEAWMATKADAVAASTTVLLRTQESRAVIVALRYPGLLRSQENAVGRSA